MFRITLAFFLLAMALFRPFQVQRPGMMYPGDDASYFAYATAFAYGQYPSMAKEWVNEAGVAPLSRVGAGLLAAPFVAVFSVIDRAQGNSIVERRTAENVVSSWSLFGAVLAAWFYFWLTCLFLYRLVRLFYSEPIASTSVILILLCQGAAHYAFRRPVFSHIYEVFLQSAGAWLFFRTQKGPPLKLRLPALAATSTLLCALILLVRQNSAPYALLWPALILGTSGFPDGAKGRIDLKRLPWVIGSIAVGIAAFYLLKHAPMWRDPAAYADVNKLFESTGYLRVAQTPWFYLKRTWTILVGADWGLLYTAPFLLIGLCGLTCRELPMRRWHALFAAPLLINFYILIIWRGQGSWYGYRYLLFAAIPVLILPFAHLLARAREAGGWRYQALLAVAILPLVSMLPFEGTPGTELGPVTTEFGALNDGRLDYQIQAWKVFLLQPWYFFFSVLKAGPGYLIYLLAQLAGLSARLPAKFHEIYPHYVAALTIKTLLLWLTPWAMYGAWARRNRRASDR